MKLHEYPDEIDRILEAAEDQEGLLTSEQVEALDAALGGLQQKTLSLLRAIRHFEAMEEAAKSERKRLAEIEQSFGRRASSLRSYLLACMQDEGIARVVTEIGGVSRCKASRPRIRWAWAGPMPEAYSRTRVTVEPDQDALLEAWKAGCLPDGFEVTLEETIRLR